MKKINDWSISVKIFSIIIISLLPICGIVLFKVIPDMEERFTADRTLALRQVVQSAHSVLKIYDEQVKSGSITLEAAQEEAFSRINALRYSGKEYFFVYDMNGIVKSLGSDPKKKGENRYEIKDQKGTMFVKEMIEVAKSKGEGTVRYYYPRLGETEASPKLSYVIKFEPWDVFIGSGIYVDDLEKSISDFKTGIYIVLAIATLAAFLTGIYMARKIIRPIKALDDAAHKFSHGDLSVKIDIKSSDELGNLGKSFNQMIGKISEAFGEMNKEKAAAELSAKNFECVSREVKAQQDYLSKHAKILLDEMERFAKGDLTVKVERPKEEGDIQKLFTGFNEAVDNIRNMMQNVNSAVGSTLKSASDISESTEQLATGAASQSMQTSEVASAVEELTKTIVATSENINDVANLSKETSDKAKAGVQKLAETKGGILQIVTSTNKTNSIITNLSKKTEQIGEIAEVIDDIADQTNLLALNAAIEAARAGEQGRGFAVVADEVRKLAERTTKATKEISETIKSIQAEAKEAYLSMEDATKSVNTGAELTEQVAVSLEEILSGTITLENSVNQIAASSEQQSATAEEISHNIDSINNINQEASENARTIARHSEDLNRMMNELHGLIAVFRTDERTVAAASGMRMAHYSNKR